MANGEEFNIRNFWATTASEFINGVLTKPGAQLTWYEVVPGELIQVSHIQSIRELTDEELAEEQKSKLEDGEVIFPEDKDNEILEEPKSETKNSE